MAKAYYEICRPALRERLPQIMDHACAGLCGEGSECFGCDDALSRDHDFSPAFCLWLPQQTLNAHKTQIEAAFGDLPRAFAGLRVDFDAVQGRRGPLAIEAYYSFFTGLEDPPSSWREWLKIPEAQLAAAVNGEIFEDMGGLFSAWREKLAYYPEEIRLKKLAARSMQMAQSGQYNLPRCAARGETQSAFLALGKFAEAALSFVFLANRRYMPFYKWAPRLAARLPILGSELDQCLDQIAMTPIKSAAGKKLAEKLEDFCAHCANWLLASGLSDARDSWLWVHGPEIMRRVENPHLKKLNLLQDSL